MQFGAPAQPAPLCCAFEPERLRLFRDRSSDDLVGDVGWRCTPLRACDGDRQIEFARNVESDAPDFLFVGLPRFRSVVPREQRDGAHSASRRCTVSAIVPSPYSSAVRRLRFRFLLADPDRHPPVPRLHPAIAVTTATTQTHAVTLVVHHVPSGNSFDCHPLASVIVSMTPHAATAMPMTTSAAVPNESPP